MPLPIKCRQVYLTNS